MQLFMMKQYYHLLLLFPDILLCLWTILSLELVCLFVWCVVGNQCYTIDCHAIIQDFALDHWLFPFGLRFTSISWYVCIQS